MTVTEALPAFTAAAAVLFVPTGVNVRAIILGSALAGLAWIGAGP